MVLLSALIYLLARLCSLIFRAVSPAGDFCHIAENYSGNFCSHPLHFSKLTRIQPSRWQSQNACLLSGGSRVATCASLTLSSLLCSLKCVVLLFSPWINPEAGAASQNLSICPSGRAHLPNTHLRCSVHISYSDSFSYSILMSVLFVSSSKCCECTPKPCASWPRRSDQWRSREGWGLVQSLKGKGGLWGQHARHSALPTPSLEKECIF